MTALAMAVYSGDIVLLAAGIIIFGLASDRVPDSNEPKRPGL